MRATTLKIYKMVNSIYFSKKDFNEFEFWETGKILTPLEQINIFIGSNNSGKSRLIRYCFHSKDLSFIINEGKHLDNFRKEVKSMISNFENLAKQYRFNLYTAFPLLSNVNISEMGNDKFMEFYSKLSYTLNNINVDQHSYKSIRHQIGNDRNFNLSINQIQSTNSEIERKFSEIGRRDQSKIDRIYIPVLRGLRPLHDTNITEHKKSDLYAIRTSRDYFDPKNQTGLFTGSNLYEEVKRHLLGDETARIKITDFEKFLTTRIFHEQVTLIPKYDDDALHIKIGNAAQRPVYSLGDGIQTILIILFPIFMNKDNQQLVFIEEPETHLHPYWQRIFIDTLRSFHNQQFFITTHSSTFINLPGTSIYEVRKENDKTIARHIPLKSEQRKTLLNLGYRSSDILQTNYVLWLEGPSDRIYFNYWIKNVDPELKEGIHYTILFSGGANYKHIFNVDNLEAIESIRDICLHYGVCFDSDKVEPGAAVNEKKLSMCEKVKQSGHFSWITSKREIENYIPFPSYIEAVKKAHQVENITIDDSDYGDRQKYQQENTSLNYKQNIRIEDDIWRKIQLGGIEALKEITARELKKSIVNSIINTASNTSKTDKILVAEEVVNLAPEIIDAELREKITELVNKIRIANGL